MFYYYWGKDNLLFIPRNCYVEVCGIEVHCTTTANPSWYLFTCLNLSFLITYLRFCFLLFILAFFKKLNLLVSKHQSCQKFSTLVFNKVSFNYLRINIWNSKSFYCPDLLTSLLCILTTQSRIMCINLRLSYIDQPPIHGQMIWYVNAKLHFNMISTT